jgi:NAD(P)-dependent dehydrogenase (short-subunit alcohol dehydrogenase family)
MMGRTGDCTRSGTPQYPTATDFRGAPVAAGLGSPNFTRMSSTDGGRFSRTLNDADLEEIAPLTVCLASDEAQFVTGQVVVINGGRDVPQRPPKTPWMTKPVTIQLTSLVSR